jgi:hypothetical protein
MTTICDLPLIQARWPKLPGHIRQMVLALVWGAFDRHAEERRFWRVLSGFKRQTGTGREEADWSGTG